MDITTVDYEKELEECTYIQIIYIFCAPLVKFQIIWVEELTVVTVWEIENPAVKAIKKNSSQLAENISCAHLLSKTDTPNKKNIVPTLTLSRLIFHLLITILFHNNYLLIQYTYSRF